MKVEINEILDVIDSYISQFIDDNKEDGTGLLHKDVDKELQLEIDKFNTWGRDCVKIGIEVGEFEDTREISLPIKDVFREVSDELVYNTYGARKLFILYLIESLAEERGFIK